MSVIDATHLATFAGRKRQRTDIDTIIIDLGTLDADTTARIAATTIGYAIADQRISELDRPERNDALHTAGVAALVTHT